MLLEFRVSNFLSFDEEQTFSFVASKDNSLEDTNVVDTDGLRTLRTAAILGANASGKSNFVRALAVAKNFIQNSATKMNLGDPIDVQPFALRAASHSEPSTFSFVVVVGGIRYDYGFSATKERVTSEWLYAYPNGPRQRWLERDYDSGTGEYSWKCLQALKKEQRGLEDRTRNNGLALARAAERNIAAVRKLYLWFCNGLRAYDQSIPPNSEGSAKQFSLKLARESDDFRDYVGRTICAADVGIVAFAVSETTLGDVSPPSFFSREAGTQFSRLFSGAKSHDWATTVHLNQETGESAQFGHGMESAGTERLLALSGPWWDTLQNGYTLVVDELDSSLHPHLVRKLVEAFQDPEQNKNGAQLLFATHDSTLMDLSFLRRDQIWLVEKTPSGASKMFSLYDFEEKPRKDEAIQRRYLGGRYGGVPVFGPGMGVQD